MKIINKFKIGSFATALALCSVGAFAQPTLPTTQNPVTTYTPFTASGDESVDYVTVGSRMPYKVDAQDPVTGLTFEYKWLFDPALTIQSLTGVTLTGNNDYYIDYEISVVMPSAPGTVKVSTNVRSLANATPMCPASSADNEYNITVVNRPTIKWVPAGVTNFCAGSATSVTIPVTLTGYTQYEIAYSIRHYANVNKTGTVVPSTGYMVLTGTDLTFPATTFATTGAYEITVTNITDRISRKSLDQSLVASIIADLPVDAYTVYVYPAPTTKPLQHVKNM